MERLQYKRPLSVVPTSAGAVDDDDSDQMDYDHLSDEVCTLILQKFYYMYYSSTLGSCIDKHALWV